MSASKQRFVVADGMTRLSKLSRNVADLDRQISELYKLRYQVRQAQRSAWKLPKAIVGRPALAPDGRARAKLRSAF
jgi:hypothetical protein